MRELHMISLNLNVEIFLNMSNQQPEIIRGA
jgi:hypothetical protein